MRPRLTIALLLGSLLSGPPAFAQPAGSARSAPNVPAQPPKTAPATPPKADPAMDAQRVESEARLKRRENDARRTLRSICKGC